MTTRPRGWACGLGRFDRRSRPHGEAQARVLGHPDVTTSPPAAGLGITLMGNTRREVVEPEVLGTDVEPRNYPHTYTRWYQRALATCEAPV